MISLLSLALVFYLADLEQFIQAIRLADYRYVALFVAISIGWLVLRTFAWRTLVKEQASWGQVFLTINEGYLLNNILPFRLGEVGRAFLLSQKIQKNGHASGFWQVFSTILVERSLDVALAATLLLSTLPFVVGASWAQQTAFITTGLIVVILGGLYGLARYRANVLRLFHRLFGRWPNLQHWAAARLQAFLNGLAILTDTRRFLTASGLILLGWLLAIVQYYTIVSAFFAQAELLWAAFSLAVMALGIAAPSSPGAVGVLELSIVGALSVFGLDPSKALAMALTAHMTNYLMTGILGAYGLARDGLTLSSLYRDVRSLSTAAGSQSTTVSDDLAGDDGTAGS